MTKETIKITVNNLADVSDGYHTIAELYDHRCLLWISLCVSRHWENPESQGAFWVRDHLEGWDLLSTELCGQQVSYHVPVKYRHCYEDRTHELLSEYKWDGHVSSDVLSRLEYFILNHGSDLAMREG